MTPKEYRESLITNRDRDIYDLAWNHGYDVGRQAGWESGLREGRYDGYCNAIRILQKNKLEEVGKP